MHQLQGTTQIILTQPTPVVNDIADFLCQNICVERLGDVVVSTLVQTFDHKVLTNFSREQDDRKPGRITIFFQPSAKFISIHSAHHHVGDHDVAGTLTQIVQSRFRTLLRNNMVVAGKRHTQILQQLGVVVHKEDRILVVSVPFFVQRLAFSCFHLFVFCNIVFQYILID